MPENLASNSANLQPVGMHVMHDVHIYVSDCAVVGVPLSDTDTVTVTVTESVAQSVPTRVTTAVAMLPREIRSYFAREVCSLPYPFMVLSL